MENSLKNRYIPSHVYDDINSNLDSLKEQSIRLNETFKDLEVKCSNFEIIQDNDIDNIISILRTYVLLKESCLEKSCDIVPIEDVNSINLLCERINAHRSISISMANDILKYAYEFLKIVSDNIITDGLLQDHKEKLKSIIDKTLKDFVDIDNITEQLKPYKIAIQYISKEITDLTEYAELLSSTFGAILFYNIISGNNIKYEPNTTIENMSNYDEVPNIKITWDDDFEVYDNQLSFFEENENTSDYLTIENTLTQEETSILEPQEDNDEQDVISSMDYDFEEPQQQEQEEENIEEEELEETSPIEPIDETIVDVEEFNSIEEIEKIEEFENRQEETPFSENLSTEFQENVEPQLEELEEENAQVLQTTDILETEVQNEIQSEVESEIIETSSKSTFIEDTYNESLKDEEKKSFFKELSSKILESQKDRIIPLKGDTLTKDEILNKVFNLILNKQFCCASIILKEYSHLDDLNILYNQFGLAVDDPLITEYDYSTAFAQTFDERLQPWFEICSLLRAMFKSENKESESYGFELYMNSIKDNSPEIVENIAKFDEMLEVFEYIKYNTDYIIGVNVYEQRNTIINDLKKQAKDKLSYCDQIASSWKNSKLKIANSLFSSNGGYLYKLIKQISLGNLTALTDIKAYYEQFLDDNGSISKQKISNYHEQLWTNLGESKNSSDFHTGYKNKFHDKLYSILKFFQLCIEKTKNFENNYINDNNVSKYREKKGNLLKIFKLNLLRLEEKIKNPEIADIDKIGMICLYDTFTDIALYINNCEYLEQNYYYVNLLKTGYFLLDDNYIPSTYSCTDTNTTTISDINNIYGLTPCDRVLMHLQEDLKFQSGDNLKDFKDAIKYNVKRKNKKNVYQIVHYLNDIKLTPNSLQEYTNQVDNVLYNLESKSKDFINSIDALYVNEALCDKGIIKKIFDIENLVKNTVNLNGNYGFYEFVLSGLNKYAMKVSKFLYQRDVIINSISSDSEYYTNINRYVDSYNYSVADELIGMYFNNKPYPNSMELPQENSIQEYNEIFAQFIKFNKDYKDKLDALDCSATYTHMNDVYDNNIKPIVNNLLSSDRYDYATSEELIGCWPKSENIVTNVVYDILTNIGFGVEISSHISNTIIDLKLSNSEKNNCIPYTIPQHTMFLNRTWNLSRAEEKVSKLHIQEDTLIVLDYAIRYNNRKRFVDIIKKISNGYNVVVVDRCVIMYLTTIPRIKRKLAFKVCSLFNINSGDFQVNNFRNQYVELFKNESGILLGREGMGKTSILKRLEEELSQNSDNIVLSINSIDDTLEYPNKIDKVCQSLDLKIYSDTWTAFEKSLMSYLKKNVNTRVYLLIDNSDELLDNGSNFEVSPLEVLNRLSKSTNGMFNFVLTADNQYRYVQYIEREQIKRYVLKPLEYRETAEIFKSNLNGAKISISDMDIMNTLISKSFGYPKMVELISRQIVKVVSSEDNIFEDKYSYDLTQNIISKALSSDEYVQNSICALLRLIIGSDLRVSNIIPVIYSMVYTLDENSGCSLEDIKEALNVSNIEETSEFNILDTLQQLIDLNLILYIDGQYYFNHNAFKNYLGGSEFAGTMLDEYSNMFEKDGIV
ncbi:MAG: AAA family ATPase [Oscillospiraceae bacterium]